MKKLFAAVVCLLLIFTSIQAQKPPLKVDSLKIGEKNVTGFFDALDDDNNLTSVGVGDTAVSRAKIKDSAVDSTKLDTDAVITEKIKDDAISSDKIKKDAISNNHIQDHAVDSSKIANKAVNTDKIDDDAVTADQIATLAIQTAHLGPGIVVNTKLADGAVFGDKVANYGITSLKMANASVYERAIADEAVTTDKIKDGTLTEQDLSPELLATLSLKSRLTLNPDDLTLELYITGPDTFFRVKELGILTSHLADGAVTSAKIADGTITEQDIGNRQVTEDKLDDWAVSTVKIRDRAVTTIKIDTGAVTNPIIAHEAVTTNKISDLQITTRKIADEAVTVDKLDEDAVTTPKIKDRNVTEAKLADGAVNSRGIEDSSITRIDLNEEINYLISRAVAGSYPPDNVTLEIKDVETDTVWQIKDEGVGTDKLADLAVTTDKIVTDAVDSTKVAPDAVTTIGVKDSTILMRDLNKSVIDHIFASDSVVYLGENIIFIEQDDDIQTAIDTLVNRSSTNWYTLLLEPGRHTITRSIRLYPYIALVGLGDPDDTEIYANMDSSLVEADSGLVTIKNITFRNDAVLTTGGLSWGPKSPVRVNIVSSLNTIPRPVTLENLNIYYYCNNIGADISGIYLNGYFDSYPDRGTIIRDCYIQRMSASVGNYGILISATGGSSSYNSLANSLIIEDCRVYNCHYGISISNVQQEFVFIKDCITNLCNISIGVSSTSAENTGEIDCVVNILGGSIINGASYDIEAGGSSICYTTVNVKGVRYNPDNVYDGSYAVINNLDDPEGGVTTSSILDNTIAMDDISLPVQEEIRDSSYVTLKADTFKVASDTVKVYADADGNLVLYDKLKGARTLTDLAEASSGTGLSGNVMYLEPSDDIEDSLEALAATVSSPWTILMAPGKYTLTGDITIPCGNFSIIGLGEHPSQTEIYYNASDNILYAGGNNWGLYNLKLHRNPTSTNTTYMIYATYSDAANPGQFHIENCVIDDSTSGGGALLIQNKQAVNSVICNCEFYQRYGTEANGDAVSLEWAASTISFSTTEYSFIIEGCKFVNWDYGIDHNGSVLHAYYQNNQFSDCDYGINLYGHNATYVTNIHLDGNRYYSCDDDILLNNSAGTNLLTVWDNQAEGERNRTAASGDNFNVFYHQAYLYFYLNYGTDTITPSLTQNTWSRIAGHSGSYNYGGYVEGDSCKIDTDGFYKLDATFSFYGTASDVYEFAPRVNGSLSTNCMITVETIGTEKITVTLNGILIIAADQWVSMWVRNTGDGDSPTILQSNWSLTKIRDN